MSKEKLRFNVGGKAIVYEGRPENRPKDLIDILVKMNMDSAAAVKAFRDNIEEAGGYSDDDIVARFAEAKRLYAEKKLKKQSAAAGGVASDQAQNVEDERPQTITLSFNGKQFSYEGLLSGKQHAVLELLIKQNATRDVAVETFRANLPHINATEDQIWAMVIEAKEAKAARKAAKKREAAEQVQHGAGAQGDGGRSSASTRIPSVDAIDELASMSVEERDSISNFIKQVLEQPEKDLTTRLRSDRNMGVMMGLHNQTAAATSTPAAAPATTSVGGGGDDEALQATTRSTKGRIAIYCQESNNTANKVMYITPTTTFEEFGSMVEKKFGRKMVLSFYEGDDVIDMDDDDVFLMFIELSQAQAQEGKRMKVICAPPESRKQVTDDKLTDAKDVVMPSGADELRVKPYSKGLMEVKEIRTYTAHTSAVYCCAFAPKGDRFCTASRDRSVRLWNTNTGSCSVMKGGHNGFVLSCDFSPRGNRIVSSSDDRTIKIWNVATCSKVCTLKGHEDKVYCVQYNSTGDYIASASCDHTVRVWNASTGSKMVTLNGHTLAVFFCSFSNTDAGKFVVSAGDDRLIKIWDWGRDEEHRSLPGHTDTVWSCKFSHDDSRIVSSSMNYEIKVWDWNRSSCLLSWKGHQVPIHQAMFSVSDKYIYTCARDWTVMVWNAETGEHCETISGHQSTVYHMDVNGNKLLTSSLDDTLKLWSITEKE
ncbi:WD domain [Trypanosoma vivax]|nr:WD domain [Trypanosoma vivax]